MLIYFNWVFSFYFHDNKLDHILFYLLHRSINSIIYNEKYSFHGDLNVLFLHINQLEELNITTYDALVGQMMEDKTVLDAMEFASARPTA